jgi:hypothetical protein
MMDSTKADEEDTTMNLHRLTPTIMSGVSTFSTTTQPHLNINHKSKRLPSSVSTDFGTCFYLIGCTRFIFRLEATLIDIKQLQMDEWPLGHGSYSSVSKARWTKNGDTPSVDVAVKIINGDNILKLRHEVI